MFGIEEYWKRRLQGSSRLKRSHLDGWSENPKTVEGFVEPELVLLEGDPETAKLLIVAAPGAVGKSSFARCLADAVNFAIVDLAQTSPLGGNFFKGGLANAFGLDALSAAAKGEVGLVVDALDEAQLRAGPLGYEAGLLDLASIAGSADALPAVMFGRALAAEDAYLQVSSAEFSACLFQIEFFDEARAARYLSSKLPILARRNASVLAAFRTHAEAFNRLASETRSRLTAVQGGDEPRFAGYAPVLDAICEYTLDLDELNPQSRLAELGSSSQIDLIKGIASSILDREQKKLTKQFLEQNPDYPIDEVDRLYGRDEQMDRIGAVLFGTPPPEPPTLSSSRLQAAYVDMVAQFAPQHPFLSGSAGAANLVFAAYVIVFALADGQRAETARRAMQIKPSLVSGVLFELYMNWLSENINRSLPLADVGILYQALSSQVTTGQRASLEISEENEENTLTVQFEILERIEQTTGLARQGLLWGPFRSTAESVLELRTPFSNVFLDAPIWVELGDDSIQQIGAPTEIIVAQLTILSKKILIHQASGDTVPERQTVSLIAGEADCQAVQSVTVRDAILAVSWPGARVYPWTSFVVEVPGAPTEVDFMRRRLRRILTAFRSHSRGSLVRLAAKIDHSRMTKDDRGVALVNRLVVDEILRKIEAGKFYVLNVDQMSLLLGMDYQGLQQQRFTAECDRYLARVLGEVHN